MNEIQIEQRWLGISHPTYFIADIAANHDGDLERAKMLIHLAKEKGADAAKFQNFRAAHIVSQQGFDSMSKKLSHQSTWEKPVFQVYQEASLPFEWTPILKEECDRVGIHYFSSPYDFVVVDMLEPYVPAYKIGSGDIDWLEMLSYIASKGKPILLASGAATISDVQRAVHTILPLNKQLVLMQCNTNYTASLENFRHVHLNVLKTYQVMFPDLVLGLSDHTPGHAAVLGAVALGARVIEKHFTDDNHRQGPDHLFAMNPTTWEEMVARTRELEAALGDADKRIADNERDTSIVQRRCLRAARDIQTGEQLTRDMIDVLRPATPETVKPPDIEQVIGCITLVNLPKGAALRWLDLGVA